MKNGKEINAEIMVDILQPIHDRTSCSDEKPENGFGSSSFENTRMKKDEEGIVWYTKPEKHENFRCNRCAILDILSGYTMNAVQREYFSSSSSYGTVMAAVRFVEQ